MQTQQATHRRTLTGLIVLIFTVTAVFILNVPASGQTNSKYFYETGHYVKGRFLTYWQSHGGLAQQGYPLSEEFNEQSETDGKIYTVQYFERATFEYHPESAANPVLLSLLGSFRFREIYPTGAANQVPNTLPGAVSFPQTGKRLGGAFLEYWRKNGGLAQQGYPISDEFLEVSVLDGKRYKVQYFERAVFEEHPEKEPPYNVLLSQLGRFRFQAKYGTGALLPIAPSPVPPPGAIEGIVGFPSSGVPDMDIYAVEVTDEAHEPRVYKKRTFKSPAIVGFRIEGIVPGNYNVIARPVNIEYRDCGGYSASVLCGLAIECSDHSLISVRVKAGQTTKGIEVTDWYAGDAFCAPNVPGLPPR